MSRALPGVVRRGAVRRRLAIRRGVTVALALIAVWAFITAGLGALSLRVDMCTSCHAMQPYVVAAGDSVHSGVKCVRCHQTRGTLGVIPDGLALQRRAIRAAWGAVPQGATIDEFPCLECHTRIRSGVSLARGIRVQYADFLDKPCGECHGGTAHALAERRYQVPEMDACMSCHTASPTEVTGCTMCHSTLSQRERRETDTSWRVTHGPTWKTSHGLGEIRACRSCHEVEFCARCHGTPIPHMTDWAQLHGQNLPSDVRKACATCHEPTWCDSCHGIEMPHPASFLPEHGPLTEKTGEEACARCHALAGCEDCHLRSSHPDLPGVGMGHGEAQ